MKEVFKNLVKLYSIVMAKLTEWGTAAAYAIHR